MIGLNSGLGGGWGGCRFKSGPFLSRKHEQGIKESNVSSSRNNTEHNVKQNIYINMELISLIPHDTEYKNSKNINELINNINYL